MEEAVFEGTEQEKFADKISKLLRKAESCANVGNTTEAETFISKAQELMTKYAINQAMLDAANGITTDEIEQRVFLFTGNWRKELMDICWTIAAVNSCRGVQYQTTHDDGGRKAVKVFQNYDGTFRSEVTSRKKAIKLTLTGFKSDLDRVSVLEASLRIQAMDAVIHWWEDNKETHDWRTYSQKVKMRAEFLEGFADGLSSKLHEAARTAKAEAIKTEAARTKTAEADALTSVALVLRSRKDRVDEWYDKKYGKLRAARRSYKSTLSHDAHGAGMSAGLKASTSSSPSARQGAKAIG